MTDDLPIPLACYPPPPANKGEEFHNVYDFIAFAATPVPATWGDADSSEETAYVSWWTDDDEHGAGVGIALTSPTFTESVGLTPDQADQVARLLQRAALLARSHGAALRSGPPSGDRDDA